MQVSSSLKFVPVLAAGIACGGERSPLPSSVLDYVSHYSSLALDHAVHAECADMAERLPADSLDSNCNGYDLSGDLGKVEREQRILQAENEIIAQNALNTALRGVGAYDCGFVWSEVGINSVYEIYLASNNLVLLEDDPTEANRLSASDQYLSSADWTKVNTDDPRWDKYPDTCEKWWTWRLEGLEQDFDLACTGDGYDFGPLLMQRNWLLNQLGQPSQKWYCE